MSSIVNARTVEVHMGFGDASVFVDVRGSWLDFLAAALEALRDLEGAAVSAEGKVIRVYSVDHGRVIEGEDWEAVREEVNKVVLWVCDEEDLPDILEVEAALEVAGDDDGVDVAAWAEEVDAAQSESAGYTWAETSDQPGGDVERRVFLSGGVTVHGRTSSGEVISSTMEWEGLSDAEFTIRWVAGG
ncbi:unnamed protein product [Peniophora sp. CBMAI 1063]|nr:unnamed protein product [Peniophora sp. CBMAI 1063]